jgi:hypothetical protein
MLPEDDEGTSDAEFERQMEVARKVMRENRRVLAALAEYDRTGVLRLPDESADNST